MMETDGGSVVVEEHGLFVSTEFPFLATSTDGLISDSHEWKRGLGNKMPCWPKADSRSDGITAKLLSEGGC